MTFLGSETLGDVGTNAPNGRYVAVYYTARNESNASIEVMSQLNAGMNVTDANGLGSGVTDPSVATAAASSKGYSSPDAELPAGGSITTAVAFDVPSDTGGLTLVWDAAAVRLALR